MITDSNATYVLTTEDKDRATYVRKLLNEEFIRLWVCVFYDGLGEYKVGCYDNWGGKLSIDLVKEVKDVSDDASNKYSKGISKNDKVRKD